jgi:hypothetical protein
MKTDAEFGLIRLGGEPDQTVVRCVQAAALILPVGTDEIVFRICEAIW